MNTETKHLDKSQLQSVLDTMIKYNRIDGYMGFIKDKIMFFDSKPNDAIWVIYVAKDTLQKYIDDYDLFKERLSLIGKIFINTSGNYVQMPLRISEDFRWRPEERIQIKGPMKESSGKEDGFIVHNLDYCGNERSLETAWISVDCLKINFKENRELEDLTNGKLDEELLFAKENGLDSLENCLSLLKRIDIICETTTKISVDFAPRSFYFERFKIVDGKSTLSCNGGIIFHGPHDGGGNGQAPTFSVSLNNDITPHWEIHT